jgi:hypothetical protein
MKNLKYYIPLQPLFEAKLGEKKTGDKFYVSSATLYEHPEKISVVKDDIITYYYTDTISIFLHYFIYKGNLVALETMIGSYRIPTLEELWGLVDWSEWEETGISPNGQYLWFLRNLDDKEPTIIAEPTEAILKALLQQEGKERE